MTPFIVTFYSYKGGVGRSILAANVAALLARSGKTLLWDLDIEAPGLHRVSDLASTQSNERGLFVRRILEREQIVEVLVSLALARHHVWPGLCLIALGCFDLLALHSAQIDLFLALLELHCRCSRRTAACVGERFYGLPIFCILQPHRRQQLCVSRP